MPKVLGDLSRQPERPLQVTEVVAQQKASFVLLQARHDTVLVEPVQVRPCALKGLLVQIVYLGLVECGEKAPGSSGPSSW